MPYNREKCLKNLVPTSPGEVRNPWGRPAKKAPVIVSKFLDGDPENSPPPRSRLEHILQSAYEFATSGDIEFAGRYQEMLFRFAVENNRKDIELKLKALALLDPGIKDGKYSVAEVAQRMALVEGEAPTERETSEEIEAKDG